MYGQPVVEWFSHLQLEHWSLLTTGQWLLSKLSTGFNLQFHHQSEPILGTLGSKQEYNLEGMPVHQKGKHTHTPRANLELLVCLPACFCSLEFGETEEPG